MILLAAEGLPNDQIARKPEPIAVPICENSFEMQPRTSEHLFASGSKPIKDFRESWDRACQRAGIPDLLFQICGPERGFIGNPAQE